MPEFLDAWTGSSTARRYFIAAGKQTTNLASINKASLGKLPVIVPSGDEQSRVNTRISSFDKLLPAEAARLKKLNALKSGLMGDLLTGRVPVCSESEAGVASNG